MSLTGHASPVPRFARVEPGEDHVSAGTYGSLSAIELTDEYKTINAGSPG
jgi:hypothetical protein